MIAIPFDVKDLTPEQWDRFEATAAAIVYGLDIDRLLAYRQAVAAGFFSDYPKEAQES